MLKLFIKNAVCLMAGAFLYGHHAEAASPDNERKLCAVKAPDTGKYGYVDGQGRWVVAPKYDNAYGFSEGLAEVRVNRKVGFIDLQGNEVIPPQFDDSRGNFSEGLMSVEKSGKNGYINKSGIFSINPRFSYAMTFKGGIGEISLGGKKGGIDKNGNIVIQPKYESIHYFDNGMFVVGLDNKYGVIDTGEKFVIPPVYESISLVRDGLAVAKKDGKYGYIDNNGDIVIKFKYDDGYLFSDGLAVVKVGGKYGYIDKRGKNATPISFDYAMDYSGGLMPVGIGGKYGYVDITGNTIIPLKFEFVYPFFSDAAIVKNKVNGKSLYGLIRKDGSIAADIKYEDSLTYDRPCQGGLFGFYENKSRTISLFDANGNRVTEFDRQEEARVPEYAEYYKFQRVLDGSDPQKMYLAAGTYVRSGDEAKAKQIYEAIIERFPDSDFAVKANDQLLAGKRAGDVQKARDDAAREQDRMTDQINRDARSRAYNACKEEMNACFTRTNGKGQCYRNCDSLL